jgi:hypothetical protein
MMATRRLVGRWPEGALPGGDVEFTTLTDEEEQELYRLSSFYWKEAGRCEGAKAYLAGCIMLGSALETLLILMVNCYAEEAANTKRLPTSRGKVKPLLDWNLGELLSVAKAANWLPAGLALGNDWDSKKAQVGDYAEVVRMVRNLAHPGRYRKDHMEKKVTRKYLQRQFEVVLLCRDWLVERNNKALLEHMNENRLPLDEPVNDSDSREPTCLTSWSKLLPSQG